MKFQSSEGLGHDHGLWAIIPCSPNMVTVRVSSKLKTSWESVVFTNKVGKNSRYFVGVFNKTIIPLALVGYEMIIGNSYPTRTRGIIVHYILLNLLSGPLVIFYGYYPQFFFFLRMLNMRLGPQGWVCLSQVMMSIVWFAPIIYHFSFHVSLFTQLIYCLLWILFCYFKKLTIQSVKRVYYAWPFLSISFNFVPFSLRNMRYPVSVYDTVVEQVYLVLL